MTSFSAEKNKTAALIVVFILLLFSAVFIFRLVGDKGEPITSPPPLGAGTFHVEASLSDSAGIDPETHFVLHSREPIDLNFVMENLKFEPAVIFSVKKLSKPNAFFAPDAIASEVPNPFISSFEIVPSERLSENKIYKVVINDADSAVIARPYSFAFQVKAPFQVVQTHPRNEATHAPINSGIEIAFNRENIANFQNFFEIMPSVEGTFDKRGRTMVFLPKSLQEKTIYKVTVKKGLGTADSNDTLKKNFSFIFETGETRYTGSRASFSFSGDFVEYVPGRKPVFGVSYWQIEPEKLDINIYKFKDEDEFINSYINSRNWDYGWTYYYRRNTSNAYTPEKNQKVLSFKPAIIESGYQRFIEIPQILDEGYYLLDVLVQGRREQAWLQISPVAHYHSITHDASLVWLYDFQTKEPIKGVAVSFASETRNIYGEKALGVTDAEGLLRFSTPPPLQQENYEDLEISRGPKFIKIDSKSGFPAFIKIADRWGYTYGASKGDEFWDYLSTDRYTYQMEDDVRFWGVLKGREMDLRQKKVEVGIYQGYSYYGSEYYSSQSEPLVREEVIVSQFNTIEGALSFKGLSPGFYSVYVKFNGKTISSANIQVLTYTKPAYQITVTPSRRAMFTGEEVGFDVEAKFFDGTPVSNLLLAYSGYWNSRIAGELKLDKEGKGSFYYVPAYSASERYYPRNLTMTFSPKLSEEGEMMGRGSVLVFGPNVYLQSFSKKIDDDFYLFTAKLNHIIISGNENSEDYWRNEYIGNPVPGHPLNAKVTKITYDKVETGQYYDYINKVVRKTYRYDRRETVVDSFSGFTNSEGEWTFERNFPREDGAYYIISFSGKDSTGKNIESSSFASFYSSYASWKNFNAALSIGGESSSKSFSFGEEIRLELQITEGEEPQNPKVLFYRFQNSIDEVRVVSGMNLRETFSREFSPSVQYRAVILSPFGFEESNTATAAFKYADNNLDIEISPRKEKYRPGEEIEVDFSIKDESGRPVSAELNVSAVDESIFHILPYNWQSRILSTLYRALYTSPISRASEYVTFELPQSSGGAEMGGCFTKGTPVLMDGGVSKPIEEVRAGDVVLTLEDENSGKLVPAIVQGVNSYTVDEFLVINNSLEITPEHRLFVNNKWEYAGNIKLGDELVDVNGERQTVYSINKKEVFNTRVYNITVDKYHTYFAGGYYVHNQEKGGGAPRANFRANFVDVAHFETVHTDSNGRASIKFTAPDNITAWRVTARAFEPKEMKAGEKIELIETSLPFFVDATMANTYLVGDEPVIKLRAFGDGYNPAKEVDFRITMGGDNAYDFSGKGAVYIPINAGRPEDLFLEGESSLVASAEQGEFKDSIVRGINVVKSYFRKGESSTYTLSESLTGIEGNKDGFTKLIFMDAGKGKFYRALWGNTFLGGIRADQIAAKYFGEAFLAMYFGEAEAASPLDLSGYHTPEGGVALFPYGDSDLEATSKMADLAPEFVFKDKARNYLEKSLNDEKVDIERISKALYGLASLGEPVLTKINFVKQNSALTMEDKIYISLALAKIGDTEQARIIYENDIRPNLRFQGKEAWLFNENDITRRVKLTATIAVLSSYLNLKDDSASLWNYIDTHDPKEDLDILEETLFMKSELAKLKDVTAKFRYTTSHNYEDIVLEKGRVHRTLISDVDLESIRFSDIEGDIMVSSFYERSREPSELTRNNELRLTREYMVNGRRTTLFSEGDIVLVRLDPNIATSAIDEAYQVVDYLPSGLKPITRTYDRGLSYGNMCDPIWYPAKVVDNTVYFNIYKDFDRTQYCQNRTINYYARVVSKGNYKANPAIIQSLKDLESLNISGEDKVEIK